MGSRPAPGSGISPFSRQARDGEGGARGLARAAGHGEDFVERFPAAELDDARGGDCAEDRDRLASELGHRDRDLRLLHVRFEAGGELGFELLDGEAGGLDPSDQRQRDVAVGADEDWLVGEVEAFERADHDLVVGAEDIAGGTARWLPGAAERRRRPRQAAPSTKPPKI